MGFEIREVCEADIKAVAALEKICFTDPWSEEMFSSLIKGHSGKCFAVFSDVKICAYAAVYVIAGDEQLRDGDTELANIAVSPEYRRRGIAKMLMDRVYAVAKENFCSDIFLEVRRSNLAAQSLYLSEGFIVYGERKNYYTSPREDAVLMKKKI